MSKHIFINLPMVQSRFQSRRIIVAVAVALVIATFHSAGVGATTVSEITGVWRGGDDPYYLWVGENWEGFVAKWKKLSQENLRLVDIERYVEGGNAKYAGVWRGGAGGHYLWATQGWENFTKKWKELAKKNLRLIDIETYGKGGKRYYVGLWRSGKDGYALWAAASWSSFTKKWKSLSKSGQRLIDIEGYTEGGVTKYLGVFRAGKGGYTLWKAGSWSDFTKKWKAVSKQKQRLIDFERIAEGGKFKYVGVFRSGSDGFYLWRSEPAEFFDKWEGLGAKKLRLTDLEFTVTGGKPLPVTKTKPVSASDCDQVGPYRFKGKERGRILYGVNYSKENVTGDSVISKLAVVKLVGGVCVEEGEVEYTLHYRSSAHRPVPMVETLKAGQCRCHWTNRAKGWPFEYKVRSTVKAKTSNARYRHKLSVCIAPWRNRCEIRTWDGWK